MDKRIYNKLFVHKNRKEGSEKILLGYQYNAKDLVLSKDKETTFHIPYFTAPTNIIDSSFIQDGATAGPFPAASDRILKNKKGYDNTTANGNPTEVADGVWFCSWLYASDSGPVWLDRYYNPGKITLDQAITDLDNPNGNFVYEPNNPVYTDVDSTMILDPGVMYKYFHIGENTFGNIVSSFGGLSGERIRLNLSNWKQEEDIDKSIYNREVRVTSTNGLAGVLGVTTDSAFVEKTTLKFNTTEDTEAFLFYDKSYCLTDEFTWSFWAQSDDWSGSQYTQLVGNYCSQGGVGVFIDTLSSFPMFVIPETNYGHLLFLNDDGEPFLDKSTQVVPGLSSNPGFIAVNKDNHIIVCHKDFTGTLYKVDSAGKTISTRLNFFTPNRQEEPLQLLCGPDDSVLVISNKARYFFDKQLNLLQTVEVVPDINTLAAYKYNTEKDSYALNVKAGVLDLKYIEEQEWFISMFDSNLYRDSLLFATFEDGATSFVIDPYERIWVLHGLGDISVYDPEAKNLTKPLFGFGFQNTAKQTQQNIHFFCHYDRSRDVREWRALIFYSENPQLFIVDMEGNLLKKIEKSSLFNSVTISFLKENPSLFKYICKGDVTGYEHRRVFHKLSPYKNKPQIVVKAALKDAQRSDLVFYHINSYYPLDLKPDTFHHFALITRNNKITLFINSVRASTLNFSGRYNLSYELQPSFCIGVPQGSKQSFNKEIKKPSLIFNGEIADIKVFDYPLQESYLPIFLREALKAEDMSWTLPSPATQYIEKIERVFKNKLPGFKTNFFNINLAGTGITDPATKLIVEEHIKNIVKEISPANVELVKIQWLS
jgi:hypothetical protein